MQYAKTLLICIKMRRDRRMTDREFIYTMVFVGTDAKIERTGELIRCKNCKYNPKTAMSFFDDDLIEGYMHCGHLGDDGYCSLAKGKEE